MKVYVASSWRNLRQPTVVAELKIAGHEVYDFRNPREGEHGFHWSEIDPKWKSWTPEAYRQALDNQLSVIWFASDMDALEWCDALVYVLSCGRSASLEAGWAAGAGKSTIALLADGEPDLMIKMLDHVCCTLDEVLLILSKGAPKKEVAR